MPRPKTLIRQNSLAGQIGNTHIIAPDGDFQDYTSLIPGVEKWLRKHEDEGIIKLVLYGDAFRFAINPKMMIDPECKGRDRIARLMANHPDFTLAYLQELRRLVSKPKTRIQKAMDVLRNQKQIPNSFGKQVPIEQAGDKEIARHIGGGTSAEIVKKARRELARIDKKMWG